MNYRERFEATIHHKSVDRAPFDLCGTTHTEMRHAESVVRLREYLGFSKKYDGWYRTFDERILNYFDIDTRKVGAILKPDSPLAGKISETELIDCWGLRRVYTGLYWEIKSHPLQGASIEDLEKYPWPKAENIDLSLISEYRELAKKLYNETDYIVGACHPVYGVFELGCWMCGFDDFLMKMALDPDFVHRFFEIILEYQKKVIEIYYGAIGQYIHFTTSGDDFGTQGGSFISPSMLEGMIKPYLKERINYTKKFTNSYYFHHTCGSVFPFIPHVIDAGVEILNPIQPGAKDMEPDKLKKVFGDSITFWGGIDTQFILPNSTVQDVKNEVSRVLDAISENGGYVLAPAHNLQPDVPPENIVAMFEAGKEFFLRKTK